MMAINGHAKIHISRYPKPDQPRPPLSAFNAAMFPILLLHRQRPRSRRPIPHPRKDLDRPSNSIAPRLLPFQMGRRSNLLTRLRKHQAPRPHRRRPYRPVMRRHQERRLERDRGLAAHVIERASYEYFTAAGRAVVVAPRRSRR